MATRISQSSRDHSGPSPPVPSSPPLLRSSLDSPKGSHKRKTQPRKRVINEDGTESTSFVEEPKSFSMEKEEEEKEERSEEGVSECVSPSLLDDSTVQVLGRLGHLFNNSSFQQILSDLSPTALLTSLVSSSQSADAVHPMLQLGLPPATLSSLLSPNTSSIPPNNHILIKGEPTVKEVLTTPSLAEEVKPSVLQTALTHAQATRTLTLKRKLFDNNKEALKTAISSISHEDRLDLDDLENFAQLFKKQRIKFGFTQGDVGQALGKRYGTDFSQTTISRFEALNLSFKNMCKLRPLLKEWLAEAENALANGATAADLLERPMGGMDKQLISSSSNGDEVNGAGVLKKRRKRTNLDTVQKMQLDDEFERNPRPNHSRMAEIADSLELERDVVRVWFCNRRQKMRKLEEERVSLDPLSAVDILSAQVSSPSPLPHSSSPSQAPPPTLSLLLSSHDISSPPTKTPKIEGSEE